MYTKSVVIFQRLALLASIVLLAACGGGGGNESPTEPGLSQAAPASQSQLFIAGAGIKGPLAFASVELYALDTSFDLLYERSNPLAVATTNSYAEITGLAVPEDIAPPYIMIIDGTNAIDRNTGVAPVINKLVTVITQESLDSMKPVYATPYTTLAYHMLRLEPKNGVLRTVDLNYLSMMTGIYLSKYNYEIVQAIGFGMPVGIDIFKTPPIITEDATSIEKQQLVVNYRAAIEAFSSLVYQLSRSSQPRIKTDQLLSILAYDLHGDGVIDNSSKGQDLVGIDTAVLSKNPLLLKMPNTGYRVRDIVAMIDEERSLVGSSSNVEFFKNDLVVTLTPALLDSRVDSAQETDYNGSVGNLANTTLLSGLIASAPVGAGAIFSHNFDDDNLGIYTLDDLYKNWDILGPNPGTISLTDHGTTEIVADPNGTHDKVMSVFYKEGGNVYNRGVCCSGTEWRTPLKQSDELYLSYDVMFEPGFEFSLGGKLPGLYGWTDYDEFIGGGKTPTGYNGWSGRLMWKEDGAMSQYVYHAAKSTNFGENHRWKNAKFIPGKWHTVEIRYVMNTPGVADGRIQAWFDGQPALDTGERFLFRKTDALNINGLIVTTFFGGYWASPKDQHVYFDNFVVSTKPITH